MKMRRCGWRRGKRNKDILYKEEGTKRKYT
jgi:hypothetical protein